MEKESEKEKRSWKKEKEREGRKKESFRQSQQEVKRKEVGKREKERESRRVCHFSFWEMLNYNTKKFKQSNIIFTFSLLVKTCLDVALTIKKPS